MKLEISWSVFSRIRIEYGDICATQLAGDVFLKMLNYFEVMLNNFLIFRRVKNCRILLDLCRSVFLNCPIMLIKEVEEARKQNKVNASFFFLLFFLLFNFATLIIPLYCIKINSTVLFTLLTQKTGRGKLMRLQEFEID